MRRLRLLRLAGRRRTGDLVELLRVTPEDLVTHRLFTISEAALDAGVDLVAVERRRMWKISLEHYVVHANLVDQAARRRLLKPVTGIDVAREILGRQQIEFGMFFPHAVAQELVVHRLEYEGNPADAAFD